MTNSSVQSSVHGEVLAIEINNPPINALSQTVRAGLLAAFVKAAGEPSIKGVVLVSAGRNFIAGADINEFGKPALDPVLPEVINTIEQTPIPVVSVIQGACLGGGLEVALATHRRVVNGSAMLGFPEVDLGLLPGAGGTQRAPRLIGVEAAIDLITSGRRLNATEALELGLIDRIVDADDPVAAGLAELRDIVAGRSSVVRCNEIDVTPDPEALSRARKSLAASVPHLYSPHRCLDAIEGSTLPLDQGLKKERALFSDCMQSPQRAALIHAFFAQRRVARIPESADTAKSVDRVGVIGGGTMGAGITTALLQRGFDTVMIERDEEALARGRDIVFKNLEGGVRRGKMSTEALDRIRTDLFQAATDYAALADADLVIEAVFEDMAVKKDVFEKLDAHTSSDAILASNTSYLDINEIASFTNRADRVIGLHFFSPAHIMKLVEVIVPEEASRESIATGFQLARKLGKVAVRSGVCDGFIGNRILMHYRKVADYLMLDGASPEQIDNALVKFGFRMGPFAVGDLAGLDIGWAQRKRLAPTRDPRERYVRVADRLCELGWFGRKTGQGYYVYNQGEAPVVNPAAIDILAEERAAAGIETRSFTDEEIVSRYMAAMVNEASRVIEEGIALRPVDVDAVLLFGYGFPRHRGGPMHWADTTGLDELVARNTELAKEDPWFWQTPPLLQRLADQQNTFDSLNTEAQ